MPSDIQHCQRCIAEWRFDDLLIDELGWDDVPGRVDPVEVDGEVYEFEPIAQKRTFHILHYTAPDGRPMPPYATRRKIERKVAKNIPEHIILYTDVGKTEQIWQWVKREPGQPDACREHTFRPGHSGHALAQRLDRLRVALEEEENLTSIETGRRVRASLDIEQNITRRFYDQFKQHHTTFLGFIEGIEQVADREWYASLMLNRLMFIWFIQEKGFLDGDKEYLRNRMRRMQEERGADQFYSFYRYFLRRLFHEGLAGQHHDAELEALIGNIPYVNGGLFDEHQLEKENPEIDIPDEAFEKIFDFFRGYQWHLDNRPLRHDNEINPDVLGYIFEKYINQKQMGAYYTKEDITGYISKNTIIPYLFDEAKRQCKVAFDPDGAIWRLLRKNSDPYIYNAVKHGITIDLSPTFGENTGEPRPLELPIKLPEHVEAGIDDVSKRGGWNRLAPPEAGLPTEIWREVVARRQRYDEVRGKLERGEVTSINDLITLNLNIIQFAEDVIGDCEGSNLLEAFWHALVGKRPTQRGGEFEPGISVLDPACGSGAFLFAALNILKPIYTSCLSRMRSFIAEQQRAEGGETGKFQTFQDVLKQVEKHPDEDYYVIKSIIINNLYGVDIMHEAVEICKLRLFLKLASKVEPDPAKPNYGIEALPDIDFNIRAGNSLVGYAMYDEVASALNADSNDAPQTSLDLKFEDAMSKFEELVGNANASYQRFREQQTVRTVDAREIAETKKDLRKRLDDLNDELTPYLATQQYDVSEKDPKYKNWLETHQPFHWFVEFYGIIKRGGFDVIIGNPPYVEYSKVKKEYTIRDYSTEECSNLYAYFAERNMALTHRQSYKGMIVPHSSICTDRMATLQDIFAQTDTWIASYDIRPARLFQGVDQRLAIFLQRRSAKLNCVDSSRYHRWHEEFRQHLLRTTSYASVDFNLVNNSIAKVDTIQQLRLLKKLEKYEVIGHHLNRHNNSELYFHNAPRYWVRAMDFVPYFWNERNGEGLSTQVKSLRLRSLEDAAVVVGALNSSLFYWWFIIMSDCRHLNLREIVNFPLGLDTMSTDTKEILRDLVDDLMVDLKRHSRRRQARYAATGDVEYDEFYPRHSKPIIDEIDRVLAKHYGFTDEELDFIINYDIKYRMGVDNLDGGDDDAE